MLTVDRLKTRCIANKENCSECKHMKECCELTELNTLKGIETIEHIKFNTKQGTELTFDELQFISATILSLYPIKVTEGLNVMGIIIQLDMLGLIDRADVRQIRKDWLDKRNGGESHFIV